MDYTHIFFQAFVYLLATVVTVPIAKRFGLGSVLGYLLAGIIIGPYVLALVGEDTSSVMHIAEFGVVMLLFIVGLELRPAMLWQLRRPLLITGGLQVILTIAIITLIAMLCQLNFATSVTIGMIAASSSTAIVLQMLNEKGWIKIEAGTTIFAILLFQDIAIIPMLAIFPLLGNAVTDIQHHPFMGYQQTLITCGVITLIVIAGKYLLRPVFRFVANANLHEAFTAMALLLVIGTALAMQYVGLSPALGAFLAGVVLAESEFRHELEADIQPFKGLLLGLFFISVGTNIDFTLLRQSYLVVILLVFALVLTKFGVMFCLGKVFKKPLRDNLLVSMTLAQGGEFCFVLIAYAKNQEILSPAMARELVAVAALSMLLTPLIMLFYERILVPRLNGKKHSGVSDLTQQHNPVIIAGFGRFGQVVGRFMLANKIKTTVLDIDANQVESIRKFGFEVFYGDANRMDLLHTAGIAEARLFVLAIDDTEKAIDIAKQVRKNYPKLKILIRVRSRTTIYEALKAGFDLNDIYRETFDSALNMAVNALQEFGFSKEQASSAAQLFKCVDEEHIRKLTHVYKGKIDQDYISQARQNSIDLENILLADRKAGKVEVK